MAVDTSSKTEAPPATRPSSSPELVVVHPLVLLSVVDHYNRAAKDTTKRVVGLLLGESHKGRIDVTNSFAGEQRNRARLALVLRACRGIVSWHAAQADHKPAVIRNQCRSRRMRTTHRSGFWTTPIWTRCSECSRRSTVRLTGTRVSPPTGVARREEQRSGRKQGGLLGGVVYWCTAADALQ